MSAGRAVLFVLRGYGQMFLANHAGVGALFFLALLIATPIGGLLSLLGAIIITATGWWLGRSSDMLNTGLFSVNGVLIGALWSQFPEVPLAWQATLTCLGAVWMACWMVPVTRWLKHRHSPYVLFSLPYVLAAWLCLFLLGSQNLTHPALLQGWMALAARQPDQAAEAFQRAKVTSPQASAVRLDGLGWASFHLRNYGESRLYFEKAVAQDHSLADAYDGLGWTLLKMSHYSEAGDAFAAALKRDAWLADAWDGLGWAAKMQGQQRQSHHAFWRALIAASLFPDAWEQLLPKNPLVYSIKPWISARYERLSSRTLLCWFLFAIGLLWHSRISFVMGASALVLCLTSARCLPIHLSAYADASFVLNMTALWVAVGGHYLRLGVASILWLIVGTLALAVGYSYLALPLTSGGLPLLCLPFNVGLLATIAVLGRLPGRRVPLDWAVTNPETIRLWVVKKLNAEECWRKLRTAVSK